MNSNSHTLTGRTTFQPGKYFEIVGHNQIRPVILKNTVEGKMGVHPSTHETVWHPVYNGKVLRMTFFGSTFKPENYPQLQVVS